MLNTPVVGKPDEIVAGDPERRYAAGRRNARPRAR
jgi:hypothetical protein